MEFLFFRILSVTFDLPNVAHSAPSQALSTAEHVRVCFLFAPLFPRLLNDQFPLREAFHLVGSLARLVQMGSIFRLSFSSVFLFLLAATVHACRDAPLHSSAFRLVRSFARCCVRSSSRLPRSSAHSHRTRPIPLASDRRFPFASTSRPSVAMAYQAMQKSWFKMPAYSAVYNPAKKDIEAGDKSTKRQQRTNEAAEIGSGSKLDTARCIRMTQLCCHAALSALLLRVRAVLSPSSVQSSSTRASCRR
jgi:hypothetical protein